MLSSIKKKFPLFMKDICNNFATLTHYGNREVYCIPRYISAPLIKYCENNKNPNCDEFITTIPSYFLSNHCQNRNSMIITKENIVDK